ncbi:trehalose utilization-domain-containing protein [Mycena alexandri]|uniref:Trehalose utilization-domain-containing protein n=1 Tax=Mycena alexandri TaxID=1745969 RepID=A0AAD6X978_9AGAR|nr:trehalose utilization-domain-containing protein [Mycena alexandri]
MLGISRKIIPWVVLNCYYASTVSSSQARVLVYTATLGFRHDSIPTAVEALNNQTATINVAFDHTEDQTQFNDQNLAKYDAIMFVSTTGEVLDDSGKTAFQNYLNLGGNFVGVHSCSDSLVNTTFYGKEVGAYFDYHPALQNATVDVLDATHPSVSMLPAEWHIQEEMYNFKSDPRAIGATVVLSANESSYVDTGTRNFNQGTPHPSAWFQEHGAGVESGHIAGRSFYTSLGHLNETWHDSLFMAHVIGGLTWAFQANTTRAFNSSALVGNAASASPSNSAPSGASPTPSAPGESSASLRKQVNAVASLVGAGVACIIWCL